MIYFACASFSRSLASRVSASATSASMRAGSRLESVTPMASAL